MTSSKDFFFETSQALRNGDCRKQKGNNQNISDPIIPLAAFCMTDGPAS
jgi:hypothetical protein